MPTAAALIAVLLALAVAGCAQAQSTSTEGFEGEEKAVAEVVADLSADAQRGRHADVCDDVLSDRLQREVAAGSSCISEVEKAFQDANAVAIDVDDVTLTQDTATAAVSTEDRGRTVKRTFRLVREDGGWRIDSFG